MAAENRLSMFDFNATKRRTQRFSIFALPIVSPLQPHRSKDAAQSTEGSKCDEEIKEVVKVNKPKGTKSKASLFSLLALTLVLAYAVLLALFVWDYDSVPLREFPIISLVPDTLIDSNAFRELQNSTISYFIQGTSVQEFQQLVGGFPDYAQVGLIQHIATCNPEDMIELARFASENNVHSVCLQSSRTSYDDVSSCLLLLNKELTGYDWYPFTSIVYS